MADIKFYTNPMSRGQTTRWLLEELGEPYETVLLDYDSGLKSPEYLAINPMGKVPAIKHGDTVVTESAAICAYLADAFPRAGLAPPPGDKRRGPYYRWLFFASGPIEAVVTGKGLNLLAPADKSRMVGYGSFEDTVDTIEKAVAGREYLCGDSFTAADLYVGSQIGFAMSFGIFPERPAFGDYVDRLRARPAYKRAADLDAAAAAKQES